jgi:hypothetical protein
MNEYSMNPQMFRPQPQALASLLMVRLPETLQVLEYKAYCDFLGQRIEWMIQQWLQVETLPQTHRRLEQALYHLNSSQQAPTLPSEPTWVWTSDWAATFLEYNDVLGQKLEQAFPVTLRMMNLDREEQWSLAHDQTTLADWLALLTQGLVTSDL